MSYLPGVIHKKHSQMPMTASDDAPKKCEFSLLLTKEQWNSYQMCSCESLHLALGDFIFLAKMHPVTSFGNQLSMCPKKVTVISTVTDIEMPIPGLPYWFLTLKQTDTTVCCSERLYPPFLSLVL